MSTLAQRALNEGISLTEEQVSLFEKYRELILEWNTRIDITKITDPKEVDNKHFLDSLSVFRILDPKPDMTVIDIGTGGGFPGIPMKIISPFLKITLLDSLGKRVRFLQEVIKELDLPETTAIQGRAEEFFRERKYREKYDIAVARAVAPLPTLVEYCLPAVKVGGVFLAMKGPTAREEIMHSIHAIRKLGGEIEKEDQFTWTEEKFQRTLILIRKIKATPLLYPRGQGKPRKNPL